MVKNFESFINESRLPVSVEPGDIIVDCDVFAHMMYGISYYDFNDEMDSASEAAAARKDVKSKMKEFASDIKLNMNLNKIGIKISYKRDGVVISGVTDTNYWKYIKILSKVDFPGELYFDDLLYFLPESDVDEDELYDKVQDWCWN